MERKIRKNGIENLNTKVVNKTIKKNPDNKVLTDIYDELSKVIFEVEGASTYYFWNEAKGRNEQVNSKSELRNKAKYVFSDMLVNNVPVQPELIDEYISCPIMTVQGTMALPLAGPIAEYENKYYINSFVDNAMLPDTVDFDEKDIEVLNKYLPVLGRGNFSLDYDLTLDKFVDIVVDHNYVENSKEHLINFFFNWVAGIYQTPGISYPTVPCFFGRVPGTGKGFLLAIIEKIVGNCLMNTSQKSGTSQFNAHTDGMLILNYNEVDDLKDFYNKVIKSENSEQTRMIEGKGSNQRKAINISNTTLCSNKLTPFQIDKGDRRLVVIQTVSGSEEEVKNVQESVISTITELGGTMEAAALKVAKSLSKIIACCDTSRATKYLFKAIKTEAKELMEDAYKSPIERFFTDSSVDFFDVKKSKSVAKRTSIKTLENLFSIWIKDDEDSLGNVSGGYTKTKEAFRTAVKSLAQEKKYVCNVNKTLEYTDDFYNWLVEERKENTSNIEELQSAREKANQRFKKVLGEK